MSEPTVGEPPAPPGEPPAGGAHVPAPAPPPPARSKQRSSTRNILEWAAVIIGAIVVAVVVKTVFVQAFRIPSESMDPTLITGDRVLVNKLSYKLHAVHRGDVVVFDRPKALPGGPDDPKDLIKRVIGLPGDTLYARNGVVYVNDHPLKEPYLPKGTTTVNMDQPVTVPKGQVWVMGDNRGNSQDSRVFGTIPESSIVGRAFFLMWPLNRLGSL
jgi:signal peptidase I